MTELTYRGFGGVALSTKQSGDGDAPSVLILQDDRQDWSVIADALQDAGRQVIGLKMRGSVESQSNEFFALDVDIEDVKAVLAQMPARPAILASSAAALIAAVALGEGGAHQASALVLIEEAGGGIIAADSAVHERFLQSASAIKLPVLHVQSDGSLDLAALPNREVVELTLSVGDSTDERADTLNAVMLDFLERHVPLAAPEYREGSDARTFRDALGCFATGVTVVTTTDSYSEPVGLTANSFTSVSLDPPLLLVCIANGSSSAAVLESAERFAINILQIGQQLTSNRFAGKNEDRFAETPWQMSEFGIPVLTGALASFECVREAIYPAGDHFILVGKVLKARFEPQRDPLLYFRGKYRRLHFH